MSWKLLKRGPEGATCLICRGPVDTTIPCWKGKSTMGQDVFIESSCTGDHGCAILTRRFGEHTKHHDVRSVCSLLSWLGGRGLEELRRAG